MEVNTIEEVTKLDNVTGYRYNCTLEEIAIGCDIKMYLDYTVLVLIGINAIGKYDIVNFQVLLNWGTDLSI